MAMMITRKPSCTPYFPGSVKPARPGVYSTSCADITKLGGAYGYFDGRRWSAFGHWGDYSREPNFVWRGLTQPSKHPDDRVHET